MPTTLVSVSGLRPTMVSAPERMVAGGKHTVALRHSRSILAVALPVSSASTLCFKYFAAYAYRDVLLQRAA